MEGKTIRNSRRKTENGDGVQADGENIFESDAANSKIKIFRILFWFYFWAYFDGVPF